MTFNSDLLLETLFCEAIMTTIIQKASYVTRSSSWITLDWFPPTTSWLRRVSLETALGGATVRTHSAALLIVAKTSHRCGVTYWMMILLYNKVVRSTANFIMPRRRSLLAFTARRGSFLLAAYCIIINTAKRLVAFQGFVFRIFNTCARALPVERRYLLILSSNDYYLPYTCLLYTSRCV